MEHTMDQSTPPPKESRTIISCDIANYCFLRSSYSHRRSAVVEFHFMRDADANKFAVAVVALDCRCRRCLGHLPDYR